MDWAKATLSRQQLVLFPERLDEAIGPEHRVRLLDEILGQLDWSTWEHKYELRRGQPPIHPKVLAGVILYSLMNRIRSSRAMEEALEVRIDFRWLAEGRSIDHTTLSEFRRKHHEGLKATFVQIGLLARRLGWLTLECLGFDGTRIRANNRRSGTRTPEDLRQMRQDLAAKYAELDAKLTASDSADEEHFGQNNAQALSKELADIEHRQQQVEAALAELKRLEENDLKVPSRIPITDPESRVTPNKEGGFAPNYTPLATVDIDSGFIVSVDVISNTDEDKHMLPAIEEVQTDFGLSTPPKQLLADGMMATGENIAACESLGIELFSPVKEAFLANNPALRDDPSVPVAAELRDQLPTNTVKRSGKESKQLDKQAFIYDEANDCYWCPEGKPLPFENTTTEKRSGGTTRVRDRYMASAKDCQECPLVQMCLQGDAKRRMINREQHDAQRQTHAKKMATPAAKKTYSRRRHAVERPFAVIKQQMGARNFLLSGIVSVKQEWRWLASAFNLSRLMSLMRGTGPPQPQSI